MFDEKNEVKVDRSSFVFVRLKDYCINTKNLLLKSELKRSMYYQRIFFTDNIKDEVTNNEPCFDSLDVSNQFGNIIIPDRCSKKFNNAWVVKRVKGGRFMDVRYNNDDIKLLLCFAGSSCFDYIGLTEKLVLASRVNDAISDFYSYYGEEGKEMLRKRFNSYIKNGLDQNCCPLSSSYPSIIPMYERSKYSVHSLINDLCKSHAKILMNEELLGKYNKISFGAVIDKGDEDVIIDEDKWCDLVGLLGNKSRANLSVRINQTVVIKNIEKNDFGIDEEITVNGPRTFCIIKDGMLWQKRLAVKVDKTLKRKLKRYKNLICGELFNDDELVLDLTKLPIETKSRTYCFSVSEISRIALKERLASIALEYLGNIYPEKSKERTDKDKFLNRYGVVDGEFDFSYCKTKPTETYRELIYPITYSIDYLDLCSMRRRKNYLSFSSDNKSDNVIIDNFLYKNGFSGSLKPEEVEEKRKYWSEEKEKARVRLRSSVFSLIMNKRLEFSIKDKGIKSLNPGATVKVRAYNLDFDVQVTWYVNSDWVIVSKEK